MSGTTARFTLDEDAARAYIARALRRYAAIYSGGTADGTDEGIELAPGWNPRELIYGESWQADFLVADAWLAGVITGPAEVQLVGFADSEGGMYVWRIAAPGGGLAIVTPYFEEVRRLVDGKGAQGALNLLGEAVAAGNELLAALDRYIAARFNGSNGGPHLCEGTVEDNGVCDRCEQWIDRSKPDPDDDGHHLARKLAAEMNETEGIPGFDY